MRFRHPDGSTVHLAYCSNVHPAEDLDGVIDQLSRFSGPVRARLGAGRLGVGLWLSAPVAEQLAGSAAGLERLRTTLDEHRLEVVTFNGFPYRGFHEPVVKQAVYHPDWSEPTRADYTLTLARILAALLPDDVTDGSISTLPLAWREPWDDGRAAACAAQLARVAAGLAHLEDETGKAIRLALEPEPGCVLDRVADSARWFPAVANDRVGVCLDACHLAVTFDDPYEAVHHWTSGPGAGVVKVQVSAALRSYDARRERARLARSVEARFLHQVRERSGSGTVAYADDLDEALAGGLPGAGEWRVHFHVPVHLDRGTTQPELIALLGVLAGGPAPLSRHLEVETYTWSVLPDPPAGDAGLVAGLAAELGWAREQLIALGLEEIP